MERNSRMAGTIASMISSSPHTTTTTNIMRHRTTRCSRADRRRWRTRTTSPSPSSTPFRRHRRGHGRIAATQRATIPPAEGERTTSDSSRGWPSHRRCAPPSSCARLRRYFRNGAITGGLSRTRGATTGGSFVGTTTGITRWTIRIVIGGGGGMMRFMRRTAVVGWNRTTARTRRPLLSPTETTPPTAATTYSSTLPPPPLPPPTTTTGSNPSDVITPERATPAPACSCPSYSATTPGE
mmetsp:Transcript_7159/g.17804  ORF Transcript_7159/g.17804 Transcript_7159/m.17804 type:complete len:239 (-) Transcript_7159:142-858(-)